MFRGRGRKIPSFLLVDSDGHLFFEAGHGKGKTDTEFAFTRFTRKLLRLRIKIFDLTYHIYLY